MTMRGTFAASAIAAMSVLAGCGSDDRGEEPAAAGTTAAPSATGASAVPTTGSATTPTSLSSARTDGWPEEAPPEHGGSFWAVYLAVGPNGDPGLAEARDYLAERGYTATEQELGCDVEAAGALGRDPRDHAVAVYFERRDQAGAFLGLLKPAGSPDEGRGFVEMLRVTRGCLD